MQTIVRMNYEELKSQSELVEELLNLSSCTFKFVPNWEHPCIVPSTFRVYSKKVPAAETAREFINNVKCTIPSEHIRIRTSEDFEKARYMIQDWRNATQETSNRLEEKIKLQNNYFRGVIYE